MRSVKEKDFGKVCETIKKTAFKITRVGQLVAYEASKRLNVPFGIIDLSLAPTPAVGDSIAEIFEALGLERAGAPGTTAALAMLNDQVKKGGVMASSYVGGLSGAFIPVSEDQGMIDAVNDGALTLEKLEAMTCVCSVGLDMIAIPGDTKADDHRRNYRRRDGDWYGKPENDSGPCHSGTGQESRRYGRIWRPSWLCTDYAGQYIWL